MSYLSDWYIIHHMVFIYLYDLDMIVGSYLLNFALIYYKPQLICKNFDKVQNKYTSLTFMTFLYFHNKKFLSAILLWATDLICAQMNEFDVIIDDHYKNHIFESFWIKEFDNQLHKIIMSTHQRVTIILHIKEFNSAFFF